jgi:hypothetical protein
MQSEKASDFGESKGFDKSTEQNNFRARTFSGQEISGQSFRLSLFRHKRDNRPQLVTQTWREMCERFRKPEVRREKDGALFSPAIFEPALRRKENVTELSMLVLDIDHNAELETLKTRLAAFGSAFAIYSTHSHLRQTESNPNAEPRFRVCFPLARPIPAKDFPALWQGFKSISGLPIDESAKDQSRIYYTPAIFSEDAPYECFIGGSALLDWEILLRHSFSTNGSESGNGHKTSDTPVFEFYEDRHAELCRRVGMQARATGRGTFEMKCPAHNGKGNSSLFYEPEKQIVVCLKKPDKCNYFEILRAFGLPDEYLPKRDWSSENARQNSNEKKPLRRLKTVKLSEVSAREVQWLWQNYIPLGALTILEGEEGLGKTWLLCVIASATAQGYGLPNNPATESATVLMMSAEDSLSMVIKPRLESINAPCEKIIAIDEHFTLDAEGILRLDLELAEHSPKLVIIDPLFSFTGKINLNNDNEIRAVTGELTRLAEKYDCAIVVVRHIGKSKGMGDPRNAGLNGIGWRASARVVLLVGKDPNDERQRAIVQTKNNLAPKIEKAIGYEIIGGEFFWKDSSLTAQRMLSLPKTDEERDEQKEAVLFLRQALRDGKRNAGEVIAEAEKLGITKQRLRTARNKLGIEPKNEGFGKEKQWFWELPKNESLDVNSNDNQHLSANSTDKTSYCNNLRLDVDVSKNEHLSATDQHLSEPQNSIETNEAGKCSTCEKELSNTPGGQVFCPICLATY